MIRRIGNFSVFILLGYSRALAGVTGILEGSVVEKQSGQPLAGANVLIVGTEQGAATDSGGYFRVPNVRAGTYQVRVSMVGYTTVTLDQVSVYPDLRTEVSVELEPTSIELREVVVQVNPPLIQRGVTATAYAVTEAKIDKLPVTNFQEVVSLQAGVTQGGHIRGGRSTEVSYLVDGLPVQDVIGGGLGTDLPKGSIVQMTVQTGGFDAEYGNAQSGVVNILTKSGDNRHRLTVRGDYDGVVPGDQTNHAADVEGLLSGPLIRDKLFYFLAQDFYFTDTRWWQDFRFYFDSPVERNYSGFAKFDYRLNPSMRLSTQVLYSLRRWRDYEFSWRFNLEGLPPRSRDSYRVAAFWTHTISDRMFYAVSINRYHLKSRIGEGGKFSVDTSPYEYDFFLKYVVKGKRNWWAESRQVITTVKADWTTAFSRSHLFKAGGEVNFYDVSADILKVEPQKTFYGKPKPFDPPLNFSSVYAYSPFTGNVYVQDKIETEKNGTIFNLGVRYDFLDPRALRPALELIPKSGEEFTQEVREFVPARFKSQISPRLGLAAPVGVNWYLYVNFGVYFQFPLFEYLYSGLNPVTLSKTIPALLGNPDLEPERTQAWELGVKYLLAEELAVSFTYFQKKSKNLIDTKTLIPSKARIAGDYGFAEYVNSPEANTTGAEIVFSRERGRFVTGSVSYTLMKVEGAADVANQGLNYFEWGFPLFPREYPLSWDQRHTVKLIAEFDLPFDATANVVAQYHSGLPYTLYPTRDGFIPLDTTLIFIPNNARMRESKLLDVKVYKGFMLGSDRTRIWLYFDVRNLLDAKNVRWVDSNGRVGGELADPSAYDEPRRTRLGIKVEL